MSKIKKESTKLPDLQILGETSIKAYMETLENVNCEG